jgi:adenosylmethionine-8-amino-7-oxononanoate aminotransferase
MTRPQCSAGKRHAVLHPIVQHKQLERQQLVVAGAHDSGIVDANGTEYLDAMAGLRCVNIGYGRTELAAVAAEQMEALPYYPHTGMNLPAVSLAEQINGLLGGDNHVYFVNSGSEANEAGFKIARQYEAGVPRRVPATKRSDAIGPITVPRWAPLRPAAWASANPSSSR